MSNGLHVFCGPDLVAQLDEDSQGRLELVYAAEWLDSAEAFAISLSLPLQPTPHPASVAHSFFANLLPEGLVRERICQRLKLSADNDVALLRAIGGDCAGALSITDQAAHPRDDHYEAIDARQLAAWATGEVPVLPAITGRAGVRLSLAGAQDKLPVKQDQEGLWLPQGNSPSTHLLKFTAERFSRLPANEAFTTLLAHELGLRTVKIEILETETNPIAVIERYDRTLSEPVQRLHQEDACQALGIGPSRKYEGEGGPTLARCFDLARRYCSTPVKALDDLLRWTVFNVLAGNADAHAKNLSFLHTAGRQVELAPAYDLVCTAVYKQLDASQAMSIGGQRDPANLSREHWEGLAEATGIRPRVVLATVEELAAGAPRAAETARVCFEAERGPDPLVEQITRLLQKRARRLLRQL
jgi:serine/threonine-protein kinase HipA